MPKTDPTLSTSLAHPRIRFADRQRRLAVQLCDQRPCAALRQTTLRPQFEDAPAQVFARRSRSGFAAVCGAGPAFDKPTAPSWPVSAPVWWAWTFTGSSVTVGQKGGNDIALFLSIGSKF